MMSGHHDTQLLIPWYVNGTLNEDDMAQVERHLADCADCRASVESEIGNARSLHGGDHERLAALVAGSSERFEELRAGFPTTPPRSAKFMAFRRLPALAAALLLAVALSFVLVRPTDPELFEARTSNAADGAPVLQLVFQADTSAQDIELLLDASGSVIGAPSQHGVYRIALATSDPHALLERIRQHPAVRWAEIEL